MHLKMKKFFLISVSIFYFLPSVANASIPTWRILWIILPRVNVTHTNGITYNFTLTQDEISKIREMSTRVEQFIEEATSNAVDIEMTIIESKGTVRSLTETTERIFVGEDDFPSDIKQELEHTNEEGRPYQIKVATFRLNGDSEKLNSWHGLGSGTYARVRFLGMPYYIETETQPHPEEVWLHELLHCFESIFDNLGTMAGLHDATDYGYEDINGWYKWYWDILAGKVKKPSTGEYVGIKSDMWQYFPSNNAYWNGHTYRVLDIVKSWFGAKNYCESIGGHLVTITSEEEQNVVATLLKKAATWNYYGYWIGAQKDTQKTPKWHWVTGEAFKYTKFSEGQPNGYGNYLQMYNYPDQGNWDDTDSYANVEIHGNLYPHGMICEWEYAETPPVSILTSSHLSGGIVNTSYSFQLKADNSTVATTTWSHISGKLPNGLTLTSSGLLSGIPTAVGSFDFTVKVEINAGNTASYYNLKTFTFEVTSDCVAPVIKTVDLKDVNVGDEYHKTLEIKGSSATWSIVDKHLPADLVLSRNGEITGIPHIEGNYEFTVRAENSSGHNDKTFILTVVDTNFPATEIEMESDSNQENENNEYSDSKDSQQNDIENNDNHENNEQKRQDEITEIDDGQFDNTQSNPQQDNSEVNNPQEHSNNTSGGGGCNSYDLSGALLFLVVFPKIKIDYNK